MNGPNEIEIENRTSREIPAGEEIFVMQKPTLPEPLASLFVGIRDGIAGHKGLTTFPGEPDDLHAACLELERLGRIYRHYEDDRAIAWKASPEWVTMEDPPVICRGSLLG